MASNCISCGVLLLYPSQVLFSIACIHSHNFFSICSLDCCCSLISCLLDGSCFCLIFSAYFQYQCFQYVIFIFFAYVVVVRYESVLSIIYHETVNCFDYSA